LRASTVARVDPFVSGATVERDSLRIDADDDGIGPNCDA
jgi:hypothetical protein